MSKSTTKKSSTAKKKTTKSWAKSSKSSTRSLRKGRESREFGLEYFITEDKTTRFDARLKISQKVLLEKAATIGGFKSLSAFVIHTAQEKANDIIERHNRVLESKRDSEIFFLSITDSKRKPNNALVKAAKKYKDKNK